MNKLVVIAVSLLLLAGVGYLMTKVVGKPISNDLSVIGKGKPVLVLIYENFSPTGGEALNRLSKVTNDYDSKVEFVVADLGIPKGRAFANRYQLIDGQAIFLKNNGQPSQVISIPEDELELRNLLDSMLANLE